MENNGKLFRVAVLLRVSRDQNRIRQVAGNQYLGCDFDYFEVDSLRDLQSSLSELPDCYDGILTSGVLSDRFVTCFSGGSTIAHRYFAASVENYYRVILMQLMRDPGLSLGDIRLDMMLPEHNLPDIIDGNRLGGLMDEEKALVESLTPQGVIDFEKEMIHRYERSIRTNAYRLFITRSELAARTFREAGVPYVSMDLTAHEIFKTVKSLRREMELNALRAGQVAAVMVEFGSVPTDEQLLQAQEILAQATNTHGDAAPVINRAESRCEVLTDAGTVSLLTQNFTCCTLVDRLTHVTGIPAAVGYSTGITVQTARENAAAAARYAKSAAAYSPQSFFIDSEGLIHPLYPSRAAGTEGASGSVASQTSVNELAKRAHLSSRIMLALITALKKQQKREIGADWVSRELQVSPRMSNRILASLERAGLAEVTGKSLPEGRGRPCNIYTVHLQ